MNKPSFQYGLDINTLGWIKAEIDITLKKANTALHSYIDSPNDNFNIQNCKKYLHQIQGTLKMVELYGAAMVTEEMETLVDSLAKNLISNKKETYQVIINAITLLPEYLEKVQSGGTDIPIILLPLLNDMRAARNESLLTENALFSPNINIATPINIFDKNVNIQTLAKKLRHTCHAGMILWFTEQNINYGINQVSEVITKLDNATSNSDIHKMLWITSGVMESLLNGGLKSSIALKLLIGTVDREIKKIIDDGESTYSKNIPIPLIKNLLYYVSCSQTNNSLVKEIKQKFNLKITTPSIEIYEQLNTTNTTLAASLIQTTSSELIEELTHVVENLALFTRAESKDIDILVQSKKCLSKISDTLGLLGLGIQRTTVVEQEQHLDLLVEFMNDINEYVIMGIAKSLLSVKDSLTDLKKLTNNRFNTDTIKLGLSDVDKDKLINILLNKSNVDLYKVKKSLSDYSVAPDNHSLLSNIPHYLLKIQKRLSDLELSSASVLLNKCNQIIHHDLIINKEIPNSNALSLIAEAISSIEYYLESLIENWGQSDSLLLFAEQSLNEYEQNKNIISQHVNKQYRPTINICQ